MPQRVPLGLLKKTTLEESSGADGPLVFEDDESEPMGTQAAPRRATHDGVHGRVEESSSALRVPAPASDPVERRRGVKWAPGVQSPRMTRQALHKRARETEKHPMPPTWGELPSGAKRSRQGVPARRTVQ